MEHSLKSLTEGTLIPISLVLVMAGGIWIAGHTTFQTEANAKDIVDLRAKVDAFELMRTDLAVIREKVESIDKKVGE